MIEAALRDIGLTENEAKIYLALLKAGEQTAYDLGKNTGIYRVHVYDKLEQLMDKGLVTHVFKGAKKMFRASSPDHLKHYLEEKKRQVERQEQQVSNILPELQAFAALPKEDTHVEVFKGTEGLRYFLKDILKVGKDVFITGIDDEAYEKKVPHIMQQYFRDLRLKGIKEKVITTKKKGVFLFDKKAAPTTEYRFLAQDQFNPTNTFIYGDRVVIVTWGEPITAIMIKNKEIAKTYRGHFEHLWSIASETP